MRFHDEPCLLFLYLAIGAMQEPGAASHFGRVCAGSLTKIPVIPGWSQRVRAKRGPMTGSGPDPESRGSGFVASGRASRGPVGVAPE